MKQGTLIEWPFSGRGNRLMGIYGIVFEGVGVYVGSSCHLKRRLSQWKMLLEGRSNSSLPLNMKVAFEKCTAIKFEVLEFLTDSGLLADKEEFYISVYKEAGLLINQSLKANDNFGYRRMPGDKSPIPREIIQIDGEGKEVARYRSMANASVVTGFAKREITKILKGIRKTHRGFIFKYSEDSFLPSSRTRRPSTRGKSVVQADAFGSVIAVFSSAKDASEKTKIPARMIGKVLNGEQKSTRGFVFVFGEEAKFLTGSRISAE